MATVGGQVVDDDGFAALLARARAGEQSALSDLYRRHQARLVRVLRADVGDAAEDVASQAWLEVFGAIGRFDGDERGFRAFLFTVARRRAADHRRSRWRRPSTSMAPEALHAVADPRPVVDDVVAQGLAAEAAVRRVVEILGDDGARVVLLRIVAGLGVEEVAAIVGRSPGAVRVQQHRALKKLAAELGVEDDLDV
jgi:RNA polymerase sigma-70 factor (ECF subfamily)